mgnify:CR=1 FL=1
MTRKTKYPVYLNAGNVLVPYDPDKPLSKWQVIALVVFIALAGAIIIIVALPSRSEGQQLDCSDLKVFNCPRGTTFLEAKSYTKGSERDCCSDTTGSCKATYNNTVEKQVCPGIKNEYDCTGSTVASCQWGGK